MFSNAFLRIGALVAVVLASVVPAQEKTPDSPLRELGRWGSSVGPDAPSPVGFPIDFAAQEAMAQGDARARRWLAAHAGWRILFDPATALPWRAMGPGYAVAAPDAPEAEIRAAASVVAAALHAELGLPGDAPVLRYVGRGGSMWYVTFEQRVGGVRVDDAGLTLRIDGAGRLVMWGGRLVPVGHVRPTPLVDAATALVVAESSLRGAFLVTTGTRLVRAEPQIVVHAATTDPRTPAGLAWKLRLSADAPLAEWVVYVDATTGLVREFWNDVRHLHEGEPVRRAPEALRRRFRPSIPPASFTATVTGTVHENVPPSDPPVSVAIPDCRFNVSDAGGAGTATTDAAGQFGWTGGAGASTVTSGLDGPYISTNNVAGAQATYSGSVPGGATTLAVAWDDSNSLLAERDAFFFGTRARNNVLLRNPAETLFDGVLPANVNVSGTCNAYYNGSSINFFPAGGGCINTAFSDTVVEHEYGHHVTITIYGSHGFNVPGHLGEGFSDCQAAACEDQNLIGIGFGGVGTIIRNVDNTCQWPTSCGTEVHARGKLIGACYWHTRNEFAAAYGAAGKDVFDEYLYRHFHGSPLTEIESCLEMLLLNDDDANLLNGTPDVAKFVYGFTTLHGVPFPLELLSVAHLPLGHTANRSHPYEIHATATSLTAFPVVSGTLSYAIDGGPIVAVPMTQAFGEWVGSIPVQTGDAAIAYSLAFTEGGGTTTRLPAGAPLDAFVFRTYRPQPFFVDGFEASSGWTSAGTGQNDWQNAAPGNPNHAYDPPAAFEGTKVWGNDLSPSGFNGNYANNVDNNLTSPSIDCTGKSGVRLDYRRWLTVEDALYDVASISVSIGGGPFAQVWQNAATAGGVDHHLDRSWARHVVRLAAADGQSDVRVRFRLDTDGGLVFGGWNLDDLRLDATPALPILRSTGATTAGSTLTYRITGNPGEAFVFAADLVAPGSFIPFVGTLGLNPFSPSFLVLVAPGAGFIPPSGEFAYPVILPPGLTGYVIRLQAVVVPNDGTPNVVSELLTTTFL